MTRDAKLFLVRTQWAVERAQREVTLGMYVEMSYLSETRGHVAKMIKRRIKDFLLLPSRDSMHSDAVY